MNIKVPTLFTCGQFKRTTPESTAKYVEKVEGAELAIFAGLAHMAK